MPDLNFEVEGAESQRFAATPMLLFKLRVREILREGARPTPVHSVVLRCQVRIEPARRTYTTEQRQRLLDLFGTPERWGQTLQPMLWTHVSVIIPPFEGTATVDLPVPCSFDFNLAATKYFSALDDGDLPLCFLFSGTTFYATEEQAFQVTQISWEKESAFRLPAASWRALMDTYYPNSAWLCLRKDVFNRIDDYRRVQGLVSWERVLERLLDAAGETVRS